MSRSDYQSYSDNMYSIMTMKMESRMVDISCYVFTDELGCVSSRQAMFVDNWEREQWERSVEKWLNKKGFEWIHTANGFFAGANAKEV